jgi:tetratricopeptide (TPR) repeat protein
MDICPAAPTPVATAKFFHASDNDCPTQEAKAIDAALTADRWDEAIARADELLALRARVQGVKHFETVNAEWRLKTLRRVAPMANEDRVAYRSARTVNEQAERLFRQGKYVQAQARFEKAIEVRRRLLSDNHPETTQSFNNVPPTTAYLWPGN